VPARRGQHRRGLNEPEAIAAERGRQHQGQQAGAGKFLPARRVVAAVSRLAAGALRCLVCLARRTEQPVRQLGDCQLRLSGSEVHQVYPFGLHQPALSAGKQN
jgi:hypothetical protein